MQIGTVFAIFVVVAILMMLLFCLLTKYYSYRLKKQRVEVLQVYQMQDILQRSNQQVPQGAYEQFRKRREFAAFLKLKKKNINEDMLIQSPLKQTLDISNSIYGLGQVRKKLGNQAITLGTETCRSLASLKEFKFCERMNTMQSQRTEPIQYNYIFKLVKYNSTGINITEANTKSVSKQGDQIKLNKKVEDHFIFTEVGNFDSALEINKLEINSYGCFKYCSDIDISRIKSGQWKDIQALKMNENREQISQQSYIQLKQQMFRSD